MGVATCRQKLRWADRHIEVLQTELQMFAQSDPHLIRLEKHLERSKGELVCTWSVERLDRPPAHWPLLIGDLIHNLRSALDHAVWALAVDKCGEKIVQRNRRDIAFPISKDPKHFAQQPVLNYLDRAACAAIERAQPYVVAEANPTIDALWALQEIWNADKHRSLVLVHQVPREATITTTPAMPGNVITLHEGSLEQGTEMMRFTAPCDRTESEVKVDAETFVEIGVKPGPRSPGVPLQVGIAEIRNRVDAALTDLGF